MTKFDLSLDLWPVYSPDPGIKRDMGVSESAGSAITVVQAGGGAYKVTLALRVFC